MQALTEATGVEEIGQKEGLAPKEDERPRGKPKEQQHLSNVRRKGTGNEVRQERREPGFRRRGQGQLLPKKFKQNEG